MGIHIFNPPAPDCDPRGSGRVLYPDYYGPCGHCDCVPHTWRIDIPQVLTGNPGIDEYAAHFAGRWILTRRRAIPDSSVQRCVFVSQPIDARPFEAQSPYGSLKIGSPVDSLSLWQLAYDRESSQGSAVVEGYTGRWGLSAGFYIWTEQQYALTPETTDVLPGTNCLIGGYDEAAWIYFDETNPWRCLLPNTLIAFQGVIQSSFPSTVTVTPFWP